MCKNVHNRSGKIRDKNVIAAAISSVSIPLQFDTAITR